MGTDSSAGAAAPDASTTLGVGGVTSGQEGATPARETQAETGGSGGAGLTHSQGEIDKPSASDDTAATPAQPANAAPAPDAAGTAMQSGATGAQDTRSQQAGGTGTGLGTPETGGNQSQDDLPPPR